MYFTILSTCIFCHQSIQLMGHCPNTLILLYENSNVIVIYLKEQDCVPYPPSTLRSLFRVFALSGKDILALLKWKHSLDWQLFNKKLYKSWEYYLIECKIKSTWNCIWCFSLLPFLSFSSQSFYKSWKYQTYCSIFSFLFISLPLHSLLVCFLC